MRKYFRAKESKSIYIRSLDGAEHRETMHANKIAKEAAGPEERHYFRRTLISQIQQNKNQDAQGVNISIIESFSKVPLRTIVHRPNYSGVITLG
jgi:ribosomal protein S3